MSKLAKFSNTELSGGLLRKYPFYSALRAEMEML